MYIGKNIIRLYKNILLLMLMNKIVVKPFNSLHKTKSYQKAYQTESFLRTKHATYDDDFPIQNLVNLRCIKRLDVQWYYKIIIILNKIKWEKNMSRQISECII